tara:strand:- start:818 stop:1306 length:489 start_codon:yes stop_codon:yes gene_type:complete
MKTGTIFSQKLNAIECYELGKNISKYLNVGDTIMLNGDIGTGKTHFARSLINSRMVLENEISEVSSPSYNIVNVYDNISPIIWHVDLYRLNSSEEIYELGLFSFLDEVIMIIEWPDKMGNLKPKRYLEFIFEEINDINKRKVSIKTYGENWEDIFNSFKEIR